MSIDKNRYIAHIKDQKQIFNMKNLLDKIEIVLKNHRIESTNFLNPYEIKLAESILNRFIDISYTIYGGDKSSERKIIYIYPDYYNFTLEDIDISSIKITELNENINHRDVLGSILSLGIIRDKIGDIYLYNNKAIVVLKKDIKSYIYYNLEKVRNQNIKIIDYSIAEIIKPQEKYEIKKDTVSSLRIDNLISAAYNISRKDSQNLINSGKVKLNWEPVYKNNTELKEGDLISSKGHGRFKLDSICGISKKNRVKVILTLLV